MKNILLGTAALLLVSACTETASDNVAGKSETTTTAKAELGDWGVDLSNIDDTIRPGDDFYTYVSGKWLDSFEIPEEFSSYGSFTVLFERSEERVKKIIEDLATAEAATGSVEQKIGDFYASFVDVESINAKGLEPIVGDLATIDAAQTHDEILRIMADPVLGAQAFFGMWVDVDSKQTDRYIVYLTQSGLGLPNRDYYLDEKFAAKRIKYNSFIEEILALAGVDGAAEKAAQIFALETKIAEVHWEPAKRRNRDLTYNLKTVEELEAFAPEISWALAFDTLGLAAQREYVVREDDAIQNLAKIFAETPVETLRSYLKFHQLRNNASVLPVEFDDASFAFYGTELRGTPKKRERWKRGVSAVNRSMGEAVGQVYVDRHFPPEAKAQMDELVKNLRIALDERLDTLPWMGEETKKAAHEKLGKFTPKIGYPDKWTDYSELEVVRGDAFGNSRRASNWSWNEQIAKLGGPIDKTEWFLSPQTVNAYYSPNRNEIVFPAAILQAPFFDPGADPAVNYGGIGAVIGHEIGHGFDDQGRKSDGDGVLRDWWTEEDAANFQKLADKLGAQFGSYEPIEGFPLNPQLTMGENIGDVGGLAMAYHAYKLSLDGKEAPVLDGLTGDQRFFLSWAQVWKRVVRDEALRNQIATDPHSPAQYRVNGVVRNMDAWYDAFDVTEGDELYLAPEDRVEIW